MRVVYTSVGYTPTSLFLYLCEDSPLKGHGAAKMCSVPKNASTLNEDFGIQSVASTR